ncbi:hypothetical protein [Pinibacter soli]|uniref:Uncharacterized protein n=1 Tax=Pinibacter soli TaxID=3044211 RepID=A0ABT6RFQ3_9BACT|nr:hypothetical protein [Pinibacter soli]MDI3321395.1 hypothetical protein [Pinibacter soli]
MEDPIGRVGIGTLDPGYTLHVKGKIGYLFNIEDDNGVGNFVGLRMQSTSSTKALGLHLISDGFQNNSLRFGWYGLGGIYDWEAVPVIFGLNAPSGSLVLNDAGYLGIGTFRPTEKLAVDGNIKARKIIVTQSGWADYVFESSYKLPSIASIVSFIRIHKHLPGMSLASIIEKEGLDVGNIVKQQQEKIEELMLYVVELKVENKKLQQQQQKTEELIQYLMQIKEENLILKQAMTAYKKNGHIKRI